MASTAAPKDSSDVRPDDDYVIVGRIVGAWGLRGDLEVEVHTDFPARFSKGSVLRLGDRTAKVERSRRTGDRMLVKFDLAADRTAAEALHGRLLTVPKGEIGPLPDGTYYHFQLIDMSVRTHDGECLGTIKEILTAGGNEVFVVRGAEGREVLLPALADVVVDLDVDENRMTVRLPEGLS